MDKSTILNKLKLLDIRNPWSVTIVHELANRKGASARITPLFKASKKRLKAGRDPNASKYFKKAIANLLQYGLIVVKTTSYGPRLHLLRSVWQLEDAIIESVSATTIELSLGRKANIQWKTILKEVRKALSNHDIKLSPKVSKVLVYYFLLRRCGWRLDLENHLTPPKKKRRKRLQSPEQQPDLFLQLL